MRRHCNVNTESKFKGTGNLYIPDPTQLHVTNRVAYMYMYMYNTHSTWSYTWFSLPLITSDTSVACTLLRQVNNKIICSSERSVFACIVLWPEVHTNDFDACCNAGIDSIAMCIQIIIHTLPVVNATHAKMLHSLTWAYNYCELALSAHCTHSTFCLWGQWLVMPASSPSSNVIMWSQMLWGTFL